MSITSISLEADSSTSPHPDKLEVLGLRVLSGGNKNPDVPNPDERHGYHDELYEHISDDERSAQAAAHTDRQDDDELDFSRQATVFVPVLNWWAK